MTLSNYSLMKTHAFVQATWDCKLFSGSLDGFTLAPSCSADNDLNMDLCNDWCNTTGKWGCGVATLGFMQSPNNREY